MMTLKPVCVSAMPAVITTPNATGSLEVRERRIVDGVEPVHALDDPGHEADVPGEDRRDPEHAEVLKSTCA
jgi:hypothetical protein